MPPRTSSVAWVGAPERPGSLAGRLGATTRQALMAVMPSLDLRVWDGGPGTDRLRAWHQGVAWRTFNRAETAIFDLRGLRLDERWVLDLARRTPGILLVDDVDAWLSGHLTSSRPPTTHGSTHVLGPSRDLVSHSLGLIGHREPSQHVPTRRVVVPVPVDVPARSDITRSTGAVVVAARGDAAAAVRDLGAALARLEQLPMRWWRVVCLPREVAAVAATIDGDPTMLAEAVAVEADGDPIDSLDDAAALICLEPLDGLGTHLLVRTAQARAIPVVASAAKAHDARTSIDGGDRAPTIRSGDHRAVDLSRALCWLEREPQRSPATARLAAATRAEHDPIRMALGLRALIERAPLRLPIAALLRFTDHLDVAGSTWMPRAPRDRIALEARTLLGPPAAAAGGPALAAVRSRARAGRGCLLVSAPKSGTHLGINLLTALGIAATDQQQVLLGREVPVGIGTSDLVLRSPDGLKSARPRREVAAMLRNVSPGRCVWGHLTPEPGILELLRDLDVKVMLIVRDPRAVVRSLADWYVDDRAGHRLRDQVLGSTLDERINMAMGFVRDEPRADRLDVTWGRYAAWLDVPDVIAVRYEDLVGPQGGGSAAAQLDAIGRVARWLDLGADDDVLAEVAGQIYGGSSTFRVGKADRWADDLDASQRKVIEDHLSAPMEALGYERST